MAEWLAEWLAEWRAGGRAGGRAGRSDWLASSPPNSPTNPPHHPTQPTTHRTPVHPTVKTTGDMLPYTFHVWNAALHVAVSVLVVPTVQLAFGSVRDSVRVSIMTAIIFAVHPVHSEAVQNITGTGVLRVLAFYHFDVSHASVGVGVKV